MCTHGGVYLVDVCLTYTGVHLVGVYLTGVHLMGMCLIGVYLTGICLTSVYLIPCVTETGVLVDFLFGTFAKRFYISARIQTNLRDNFTNLSAL
jgi:hypothetical protein